MSRYNTVGFLINIKLKNACVEGIRSPISTLELYGFHNAECNENIRIQF